MKPSKEQIARGTYKRLDGLWYKRCTGPAHDQPEYLPATEKYFYMHKSGAREGEFVARCRLCNNWRKLKFPGPHNGLVPSRIVAPFFREAVNRIGMLELANRTGLSRTTVRKGLRGGEDRMQKAVVRRLMLELTSIQRKGEHSINAHSRWRQDKRNNEGLEVCAGCGGFIRSITTDCATCWERYRGWYRRGKITEKEWQEFKRVFSDKNR
jgi:hypothetical protein